MATITLYDAGGHATEHKGKAKFTFGRTRISQWATANQRQLDALIDANPHTVRATIDNFNFNVVNGRSEAAF